MNFTKNKYIKFTYKLLILLTFIFITDRLVGFYLEKLYFSQTSGLYYRTTYVMDSTKADIVIFGSSRANHHYVPQIFEDSLKMTCYNAGRDGNFLLFNYATFKALTKRYTPKVVIFDIYDQDLIYNQNIKDKLSTLLPYYNKHGEIREIVELRSSNEWLKLKSRIYPYNSSLLTMIMGNLDMNKKRKMDDRGYVSLEGIVDSANIKELTPIKIIPNKINIEILNSIIKICNQNKIKIFLVYSPIYRLDKDIRVDSVYYSISNKNNIPYYDYSFDTVYHQSAGFFKDLSHLNHYGADIFSKNLAMKIKSTLLQ